MWPPEQQGSGFDPQQPNPYKQPVQQPNPYQQPSYGYPQQGQGQYGPTGPAYPYPQQPMQPPPQPGGRKPASSTTTVIAVVTSVAVIAAAVVTGVVLLGDEEQGSKSQAGGDGSGGASASASASPSPSISSEKEDGEPRPAVPGWQTVVNPKHYAAFDVPKGEDWEVEGTSVFTGFADDETGKALVGMSAPAFYQQDWCEDSWRAVAGTKGAQGATGTKDAAKTAAVNWVIAGYDQKQEGALKRSGAKAFRNSHGIEGHIATATITDIPKGDSACDVTAGKAVAVSWLNVNDDLSLWVLVTDAGFEDEIPQSVIDQMTGSLRNFGEPGPDTSPHD